MFFIYEKAKETRFDFSEGTERVSAQKMKVSIKDFFNKCDQIKLV